MDSKGNGTKDGLQLRYTKPISNIITILALEKRIFVLT